MFHGWKEFFNFSKTERRGLYVLMFLLLLFTGGRYWLANYYRPHSTFNNEKQELLLTELRNFQELKDKEFLSNEHSENNNKSEQPLELFLFNPNDVSESEMRKLGFPERVIRNMIGYRRAGGVFRQPEDLLRIYHFPDTLYALIEEYINIPAPNIFEETEVAEDENVRQKEFTKVPQIDETLLSVYVDLNHADSIELLTVRGIGSFRAGKIIERREALGGFHDLTQLTEVFSVTDSVLQELKPQLYIDSSAIRKLKINTADFRTLVLHPYINGNLANLIINYRRQHGEFSDIAEINNLHLVNDELYRKIAPYFTVE